MFVTAILFIIILQVFDRDVKENTITAAFFHLSFLVLKCRNEKSYLIKAKKGAIISAYFMDGCSIRSKGQYFPNRHSRELMK